MSETEKAAADSTWPVDPHAQAPEAEMRAIENDARAREIATARRFLELNGHVVVDMRQQAAELRRVRGEIFAITDRTIARINHSEQLPPDRDGGDREC